MCFANYPIIFIASKPLKFSCFIEIKITVGILRCFSKLSCTYIQEIIGLSI